jgi:putative flippase GtrA
MNVIKIFCNRVAGAVKTALGAAIMFALYNVAGCGYWVSSAMSYIAGTVLSFFLNKHFMFRVTEWICGQSYTLRQELPRPKATLIYS